MTSRAGDRALPARPDPEVPSPMSAHDFPADLLRAVLHRLPPGRRLGAASAAWRRPPRRLEAAFRAKECARVSATRPPGPSGAPHPSPAWSESPSPGVGVKA
ncbi:hypothetical protein ZWY2020_004822 [Hordeum vulgare]|nr:hypothetical protein ZWY2020_004822 [Hordeum vulgare]